MHMNIELVHSHVCDRHGDRALSEKDLRINKIMVYHVSVQTRLAFNNVKSKDWHLFLIRFD